VLVKRGIRIMLPPLFEILQPGRLTDARGGWLRRAEMGQISQAIQGVRDWASSSCNSQQRRRAMNSGFSGMVSRLAAAEQAARAFDYRLGLAGAAKRDYQHGEAQSRGPRAIANRLTVST
jgi:hypothetical protein